MLINQDRFDNVFDEVKDLTCRGDVAVFVFVSMDCDGLCATHILKALFDYEHIRYSIHAISGYTDLKENFSEMIGEQDGPCAAFLINCGANTNVQEYLELDKYPGLVLTIVDSHRPMDLANIQDPDEDCQHKVYVIDSGDPDEDKPPDFSILDEMDSESEKSGSDSDSDDDMDTSDDDDEELEGQSARQRRRTSEEGDAQDVDSEEDGEADEKQRRKRKRKQRRQQKALQKEIEEYYSVTHFGASAASYMFELASQLNQKTNKLLWWNIVALTDYYVQERYTGDKYQEKVDMLQNEVGRLNLAPDDTIEDRTTPEQGRIAFAEELRFMLPKHWTLYDSMSHSRYVASRLGIWKEAGQFKLDHLLAKMGIPLAVCKQKFCHMDRKYKMMLESRIAEFADEFGLTEVTYGSFRKFNGFKSDLAAADVVYAINALLEEDDHTVTDEKGREAALSKGVAITSKNFWNAFNALADEPGKHADSHGRLVRGFETAIDIQKLVVMQGKIVIDKNQINDCGKNFQWITMSETIDASVFSKPMGLGKLALFLSAALGAKKKKRSRIRPLVVATFVPARDMYLVVGVTGAPRVGEPALLHNRFGQLFRKAANETQAQVKHDGFDLSVIEIRKEDLRKVYDYLSIND